MRIRVLIPALIISHVSITSAAQVGHKCVANCGDDAPPDQYQQQSVAPAQPSEQDQMNRAMMNGIMQGVQQGIQNWQQKKRQENEDTKQRLHEQEERERQDLQNEQTAEQQKEDQKNGELMNELLPDNAVSATTSKKDAPKGPDCKRYTDQLGKDREAIKRLQASNQQGLDAINEETKEAEDAQWDALMTGVKLLMAGGATALEHRQALMEKAKEAIETKTELAAAGRSGDAFAKSIDKSLEVYKRNSDLLAKWKAIGPDQGETLLEAWDRVKTFTTDVARDTSKTDARMKKLYESPNFKKFVREDKDLYDRYSEAVETLSATVFPGLTDLASFTVNYGYDMAKWGVAAARVMKENKIKDTDLKAFKALKKQMECTMRKIQDCQAGRPVASCHAQHRTVSSQAR